VIETLGDSLILVNQVEISFFGRIFVELYIEVELCCLIWEIYARFAKKMADYSQLILSLTLPQEKKIPFDTYLVVPFLA
jgi:hypothetical protein